MSLFTTQDASAASDSTIAGLPAEYVAQLAQEALRGDADSSDAALSALSDVVAQSSDPSRVPTSAQGFNLETLHAWTTDMVHTGWQQASEWMAQAGPSGLIWVAAGFGLLIGAGVALRGRTPTQPKPAAGHAQSPHRLAYADAVTRAAQLLAEGETPRAVAKESGLALDVIGVVRSRRLLAPPRVAAGSAGSESSSGRNRRRARAAYAGGGAK